MMREDEAAWLLDQLEQLAAKLGVTVRYEPLGDKEDDPPLKSGACRLRGRDVIIIDRYKAGAERCRILLTELKRYDLSRVYVPPRIRGLVEG